MRSLRVLLPVFILSIVMMVPLSASAATANFFGPIIPEACHCEEEGSAPDWGCALQVVQNLMNFAISMGIIIFVIMIAAAGIIFIASPISARNRETGKSILLNSVIGLVIMLSSWLLVDFVMKTLYKEDAGGQGVERLGPWNTILAGNAEDYCLDKREPATTLGGAPTPAGVTAGQAIPDHPDADGTFSYDPGIQQQNRHRSPALATLLSCMAHKVPGNVGRISSISDSQIINGSKTFTQCANTGCNHTINSCHYGGSGRCNGSSYAVDFGDEQNRTILTQAATSCGARVLDEGNHIHVSIGAANNCSCDTNL